MRVRFSKRALAQLDEILSGLNQVNPFAAQRFEQRIRSIAQRIGRFPQGFQEVEERPGVRKVPLVRYPYLMFYKVFGDEAVVLRIIHGARKEPWEDL
ncbi:MAG: type II toxin-antitoxin system RelE/ParE family toxin [Pseudolabrys sp.]|jgi:toxin ParE1/3/4